MAKEYTFICKICTGYFTTNDIGLPICRGCWSKLGASRGMLPNLFGYPKPTPLQEAKWNASKTATRLIRESQYKTNKQHEMEETKNAQN